MLTLKPDLGAVLSLKLFKNSFQIDEMTYQVKVLAAKPNDLSPVLSTHSERDELTPHKLSSDCVCVYTHMHTHQVNKCTF